MTGGIYRCIKSSRAVLMCRKKRVAYYFVAIFRLRTGDGRDGLCKETSEVICNSLNKAIEIIVFKINK